MKSNTGLISNRPLLLIGLIVVVLASAAGVSIYKQSDEQAPNPVTETEEGTNPVAAIPEPSVEPGNETPSSLAQKASTPALSVPVVAQAGLRSVHQKILKDYVSCVKNKGKDCHCQYQPARMSDCGLEDPYPDLEETFTLNTFQKESDSDLLDYIPNLTPDEIAYWGPDFKLFAVYRLKTSVEQFNKAYFVYEDGAWKYLTVNYDLGD